MITNNFDPFKNRLARDIRNSLARAFLDSLASKENSIFRAKGSEYLDQNLEQVYQDYVKNRLQHYEELISYFIGHSITDSLQLAELFWEHKLYFEMHELLEKPWKEATGDKRRALQGLIRAAGMKIHEENGNITAAISIAVKAQYQLQKYGSVLSGFAKLESILDEIKHTLITLQRD